MSGVEKVNAFNRPILRIELDLKVVQTRMRFAAAAAIAAPQPQHARPRWSTSPYGAPVQLSVALAVSVAFFAWYSWSASKHDQLTQLETVAELTEMATDRYFLQIERALSTLALDITSASGSLDLVEAQRLLVRFQEQHHELRAVSLLAWDGQFLTTSAKTFLTNLPSAAGQRDYAGIVAKLEPARPLELARPQEDPVTKRWILPMRYAVRDAHGQAIAFIVASAPVEMLQSFWSEAPIAKHASIALVRDDGYLINRYPLPEDAKAEDVFGKPRGGAAFGYLREHGFPKRGFVEGPNQLSDVVFANAFVRLEHYPVTLVAGMPTRTMAENWWQRSKLPFGLAILAITLASIVLHRLRVREVETAIAQRLAAANLRASEAFLERIGHVAGVGGWSLNLNTKTIAWTSQTYRIHEVDDAFRPTVENGIQFYAPEARPVIAAAVERGVKDGAAWDFELPFITAKGRQLWVRALGEVEFEAGRPVRIVGALQDVTENRQHRMQLEEERGLRQLAERHSEELAALLSERRNMFDVLAHEVRQPLHNASAALQGAHQVLNGRDSVGALEQLARVQTVLGKVTARIDNTLAVATLLARPHPVRLEDTDIDATLELVVEDLPREDRERVSVDRQTPIRTMLADMSLVRLALRNLLANALRHGGKDRLVTIRVSDTDDPLATFIDVIDEGPGVDPGIVDTLFQRGARKSTSPGYGLGLFIVKRVMELHAGNAVLISNAPGNVVFRLSFGC